MRCFLKWMQSSLYISTLSLIFISFTTEEFNSYPTEECYATIENDFASDDIDDQLNFDKPTGLVLKLKKIIIPGYPKAFNPSIIKNGDGFLFIFRHCPNQNSHHQSYLGVIQLNEELDPISEPEILTTREPESIIESRLQDGRLISYKNLFYVIYNDSLDSEYHVSTSRKDMYISQLVKINGHYKLLPPTKLIYGEKYNEQTVQKNWSPFVWKDKLLFSYYINPHEILYTDLATGDSSLLSKTSFESDWEYGEMRGGTPAILVKGEYLAIFHSKVKEDAINFYMGAYTFSAEPPFNITSISKKPLTHSTFYGDPIKKKRSIFPGGITESGSYIYIAYGKDNREAWVAKVKTRTLLNHLKKIRK